MMELEIKELIHDISLMDIEAINNTDEIGNDVIIGIPHLLEFIIGLEDILDDDIPDEDTEKWRTVQDVIDYINKRI